VIPADHARVLEPPPAFVRPYAPLDERVMSQPLVDAECRNSGVDVGPGLIIYGCQFFVGKTCYVVRVPDEVIRRHELAHCNGWKHPERKS
jgi:hypothetical protein